MHPFVRIVLLDETHDLSLHRRETGVLVRDTTSHDACRVVGLLGSSLPCSVLFSTLHSSVVRTPLDRRGKSTDLTGAVTHTTTAPCAVRVSQAQADPLCLEQVVRDFIGVRDGPHLLCAEVTLIAECLDAAENAHILVLPIVSVGWNQTDLCCWVSQLWPFAYTGFLPAPFHGPANPE